MAFFIVFGIIALVMYIQAKAGEAVDDEVRLRNRCKRHTWHNGACTTCHYRAGELDY